jgi:hypothetical protein
LPDPEDIEEYFFYTVLQPVKDGLVERISDYPGYNCFHDAIHGIERKFTVYKWAEFYNAARYNNKLTPNDFSEVVTLRYARIPGYDHLTQTEYAQLMKAKLEERRQKILSERREAGIGILGAQKLLRTAPGSIPRNTKRSDFQSYRPRVLSVSAARREEIKAWYFQIFFEYRHASARYRAGEPCVIFPEGTYKPMVPCSVDKLAA